MTDKQVAVLLLYLGSIEESLRTIAEAVKAEQGRANAGDQGNNGCAANSV